MKIPPSNAICAMNTNTIAPYNALCAMFTDTLKGTVLKSQTPLTDQCLTSTESDQNQFRTVIGQKKQPLQFWNQKTTKVNCNSYIGFKPKAYMDPQDSELGKGDPQFARSRSSEAVIHQGSIENRIATEMSSSKIAETQIIV